jgi:fumarate hydratase class II
MEHDSLGEVCVPASAYYGAQTQRAVENFPISGLKPFPIFIKSLGYIKLSAAEVHAQLGLLDEAKSDTLCKAAWEVIEGRFDDQFVVDPYQAGAGTSHHMNANEVIANRATELLGGKLGEYIVHPNDDVNMSQSTNDVIPTAMRLGCLLLLPELEEAVSGLAASLREKAVEFDPILKSGRTHLQDAAPVRLGQEFGAYALAVERDLERIRRASEGLHRLGIGGSAVGSGLNVHPEYSHRITEVLSKHTGLELTPSDNLFESMQSMADFTDFSASLRTLALTLNRIANDFRLLASGPTSGLDEIRLPAVQPGSSIMPGKVNPVMAEMLNMACYHVVGCDTTVMMASQAGQLELNVMMPVIAHHLFDMLGILTRSVTAFTERCVTGLQSNAEKASAWLERNPILATALNPYIGYAAAAELVKEAVARNITLRELAVEKATAGELLEIHSGKPIDPVQIDQVLSNLARLTGK